MIPLSKETHLHIDDVTDREVKVTVIINYVTDREVEVAELLSVTQTSRSLYN